MMKALFKRREMITLVGIILLAVVVTLFNTSFVTPYNLSRIANSSVMLLLLAAGVTPVARLNNRWK